MKKSLLTAFAAVLLLCSACSTVTIREKGSSKLGSDPTWSSSRPFFIAGLIGASHIDVKEICKKRPVVQMQTEHTFLDSFLGIITLGIYTPRTASVWCGKVKSEEL